MPSSVHRVGHFGVHARGRCAAGGAGVEAGSLGERLGHLGPAGVLDAHTDPTRSLHVDLAPTRVRRTGSRIPYVNRLHNDAFYVSASWGFVNAQNGYGTSFVIGGHGIRSALDGVRQAMDYLQRYGW